MNNDAKDDSIEDATEKCWQTRRAHEVKKLAVL
jgi:hypothetical protein